MTITLESVAKIPESVLYQQVAGESVLLNMDSEQYFGLDEVGTRIWQLLTEHGRLADVYAALLDEYEVEPKQLRRDLLDLTALLAEKRLIIVEGMPHDTTAAVDAA